MRIDTFINNTKQTSNEAIIKKMLNTKKYLPFAEKKALAKRIIERSTVEEGGFVRIDEIAKYLIFTTECIQAYTDLEFDEDMDVVSEEYDALAQSGKLNVVIGTFEGEYNTILSLCGMETDYLMQGNSLECQVAIFLNGITDILDRLSGALESKVSSFNMSDYIAPGQFEQLSDLLNKYIK